MVPLDRDRPEVGGDLMDDLHGDKMGFPALLGFAVVMAGWFGGIVLRVMFVVSFIYCCHVLVGAFC